MGDILSIYPQARRVTLIGQLRADVGKLVFSPQESLHDIGIEMDAVLFEDEGFGFPEEEESF